jgi:hypothetical protein
MTWPRKRPTAKEERKAVPPDCSRFTTDHKGILIKVPNNGQIMIKKTSNLITEMQTNWTLWRYNDLHCTVSFLADILSRDNGNFEFDKQ